MKVHVPFKLEQPTRDALDRKAKALGHTRSAYIRFLIESDLTESEKTMKKRTPGPWIYDHTGTSFDVGVVDGIVMLPVAQKIHSEADARLIAAAPDLLAALEEFIECGPNAGHNRELVAQVKMALKKAKGAK